MHTIYNMLLTIGTILCSSSPELLHLIKLNWIPWTMLPMPHVYFLRIILTWMNTVQTVSLEQGQSVGYCWLLGECASHKLVTLNVLLCLFLLGSNWFVYSMPSGGELSWGSQCWGCQKDLFKGVEGRGTNMLQQICIWLWIHGRINSVWDMQKGWIMFFE